MNLRTILIILMLLNSILLAGQVWPEGAPPFARLVNILTLILNLAAFGSLLKKNNSNSESEN